MVRKPVVDYKELRLSRLNTPEFSHLKLLLYWPLFGVLFLWVERFRMAEHYTVMSCALDGYIPFCEIFVIPYFAWFMFLILAHLYTLLYNVQAFRRLMYYIMVTYSLSLLIFILFPNCQMFRPETLPRDNLLSHIALWLYSFDTNTNVCPSLHVVGSVAAMLAFWECEDWASTGRRVALVLSTVCISISTVFLRQHSLLDLLAAVLVCIVGYVMVYGNHTENQRVTILR